jgi:hypothetical protein
MYPGQDFLLNQALSGVRSAWPILCVIATVFTGYRIETPQDKLGALIAARTQPRSWRRNYE